VVPHVAYRRGYQALPDGNLYYAYLDPETSSWIQMPADEGYNVGNWTDIAIDSSGNIHISYYDAADADLKYAFYNGVDWSTIIVDGLDANVGQMTSIVLDENGLPHITYYDETNNDLKHAFISTPLTKLNKKSKK
jgi:hypothetical protein